MLNFRYMDFFTISQYFNKLFSVLLLILLLPIFVFCAIYLGSSFGEPDQYSATAHVVVLPFVATDWLIIFFLFNKKIKSIPKDQGLRIKLEKYFRLTIVRYSLGAVACLVLAFGFHLTKDDVYTVSFMASLLMLGILWPVAPKVCKDMKLRGDEREMVYYKKDVL